MTYHGRARSLPFWFSAVSGPWWSLMSDGWRITNGVVVQSRYMGAVFAGAHLVSYFSEAPGAGIGPIASGPVLVMPPAKEPRPPHRWLQRLLLVVKVLFFLEIGIVLVVVPWTRLWTENSLLLGFPAVKEFLNYNFVRGLVSGLGLVDIWMGVAEAVTYREKSGN